MDKFEGIKLGILFIWIVFSVCVLTSFSSYPILYLLGKTDDSWAVILLVVTILINIILIKIKWKN